ncbi:hypothetical protein [Spirulina major]|uniref:hypothetical protein n=1 Tax=Spirulina major TaxID=270636 RepID=UPI0015871AA0|nr:hypothetical protein [Spirulina major]
MSNQRSAFLWLTLLAMGCFGLFSGLDINGFWKYYGLILSLQGGFAVMYAMQRSRR